MRNATLARLLPLGIALGLSVHAASPVPRPTKEFTVATPDGQQILLSGLKGKVTVIQFLFTWCPHCQAFSKVLTQINTEYGPRGLRALGVAFDDNITKEMTAAYAKQYAGFPVGTASRDTVLSYLGISAMERTGVPQIVVIDRKGVIREQSPTEGGGPLGDPAHLRPLIESLLNEGASTAAPAKSGPSSAKKTTTKKTT